jgi:hypothetical protein
METIPLLARVAGIMSNFGPTWALCGGWSVDAWLGRQTRDHGDVDLTVFHDDQHAVFDYFTTGWLLNGHDDHDPDGTAPWNGRRLGFPSHVHAYSDDGLHLDIQLNRRSDADWVFSTKAGIALPIARCIVPSPWGVPTLAAEAVLFYKAIGEMRPHDETDFYALAPHLAAPARVWLRDALSVLRPKHPWLPLLRDPSAP